MTLHDVEPQAPDTAPADPVDSDFAPWARLLWPTSIVLVVLGLVGVFLRVTQGHLPAGYGSYVPWGLWIAVYFHGIGIACGAFAASSAGYLLRVPGFRSRWSLRISAILVAASVGAALLAVGMDLGHFERAWRLYLTPSFTSMMAFNTWSYVALLAAVGVVWLLSFRPDRGWFKPFIMLALVISLVIPFQSGAFFAVIEAKPWWNSALLPVMFFVSAMTAGAATLLAVRGILTHGKAEGSVERDEARAAIGALRIAVLIGIGAYLALEFVEFSSALWDGQAEHEEIRLLLFGPYWWVFWLVHLLIGCAIPVLLLATRRPKLWVIAGAVVGIAFISARLNVVVPGQMIPQLPGVDEAYQTSRLEFVYNATLMEYLVTFFCIALAMAVFYVGVRVTRALDARTTEGTQSDVPR